MEEMRYTISDAAKMVKVESHVLRYWEDELSLEIPRNEMGHRYYTQHEIDVFCQIRALKDRGFQLKSIKDVMDILFHDEKTTNIISLEDVRQSYEEQTEKKEEENTKKQVLSENVEIKKVQTQPVAIAEKITSEDKMRHFKYIMDAIISKALKKLRVNHQSSLRLTILKISLIKIRKSKTAQPKNGRAVVFL